MLLHELKTHKAKARNADPDALVFPTRNGTVQHRANIPTCAAKAIERANAKLEEAGKPPITAG
jgi:hypothetical protein